MKTIRFCGEVEIESDLPADLHEGVKAHNFIIKSFPPFSLRSSEEQKENLENFSKFY